MKKIIMQATVGLLVSGVITSAMAGGPEVAPAPLVTPGLYFGAGAAFNDFATKRSYTLSETNSSFSPATRQNSLDVINLKNYKFAPEVQAGFWMPISTSWLLGLQASYKYLNFTTSTENPAQLLAASQLSNTLAGGLTSGINTYVLSSFNNELLLLAYLGRQLHQGFAYAGAGAAMWSVHDFIGPVTPSGFAGGGIFGAQDWLIAYHKQTGTIWGGAFQVGYNYYLLPTWFLGFSYTFAMSGTLNLADPSTTEAAFTGFPVYATNAGYAVSDTRKIQITTHELTATLSKVFAM